MSRLRHERKHRAAGGMTATRPVWNAGGAGGTAKEAKELKRGGRARHHGEGEEAKRRHDRPKRESGGGVNVGSVVARAKGGAVSDYHPFGKKPGHSKVSRRGMHVDGTGGHVSRARGGKAEAHADGGSVAERAEGGSVAERGAGGRLGHHQHHEHEHPDGHMKHRARGGRLRGDGTGSERTPLTGAAKIKQVVHDSTAPHGVRSH